ncbi:hypothetical protein HDU80_003936 [Chytriomyces hyalinus]|nr:hypothetical protein HDU80_003936 [Chytriomyces hyalinus]
MPLDDKIVHALTASKHLQDSSHPTADEYDHLKQEQMDQEEMYENDEMLLEEEAADIPEMELLAMMDAQEDSLLAAQRLFTLAGKSREYLVDRLRAITVETVSQLYETGYAVVDGLVDADLIEMANAAANSLAQMEGAMVAAASDRIEDDPFRDRQARDDVICWLHKNEHPATHPALDAILEILQTIQQDLATAIHFRGQTEYQLSVFKGSGGRFERHRDAFPIDDPQDEDQRRATVIVNLSSEAESREGGIKIFRPLGCEQVLENVPGRVLIFLSGVVDYEVLPVYSTRASLTSWIR